MGARTARTVECCRMDERFPIDTIRHEFPALKLTDHGQPRVYFDNPAGTQVPLRVAEATSNCLLRHNANLGGAFLTSVEAGRIVHEAHAAVAAFIGAASGEEIIIGPSMTGLTFHLSRSIGKTIGPGDEIVVTRMDHDGNIAPWLQMADDRGATVRWLPFSADSWRIEPSALDDVLSKRTRLVALNAASNLTGSINDVASLVARIHEAGALVYLDAVQYSPHELTDVAALGCDFLTCSSYKFFGPHLGIAWGRKDLLQTLVPYKVRPMGDELPDRWETGTPQIELQAGLRAAIDYLEWLGSLVGKNGDRRARIRGAFAAIKGWEQMLVGQLIAGLSEIRGLTIRGISDPARLSSRVPTVSFTHAAHKPQDVAKKLAARNIFVWSGHNYALEIVRQLGIPESEGVLRIGLAHYNTPQEVDATLTALEEILA
ncbi:MAG: cysteine desulfurase-like protein [Candidatus Eremiobacteraeota bacterium]|nr:cysteine desulfurase-like protein [Candidatus Eremiobacteraeota bacterium]